MKKYLINHIDYFKDVPHAHGSVGIYVDMGTEGFLEWIKVITNN